ncbi:MAG: aminotransferase class I/II-fold pyridoxal phosphate-dependent enzyme [Sphingobacteriales bacterium]|nr:aminotransferase class I/II-fold pyridoxal phosphate-dependent enzyme [Sphingobacteriales bacterium]
MRFSIPSKFPEMGTTIFTLMSQVAQECGAINLSQGFPDYDCSPHLQSLVYEYMRRGFNQYAPMAGAMPLREAIARKVELLYGTILQPATDITITAGATQAIHNAITAVLHAGDEAIVFEPNYDSYVPAIELCGAKPLFVRLESPDYRIPWQQVRAVISSRTRLLIVNSPHNPSGSVLRAEDIEALRRLCNDYPQLCIISDEVYEHLIFDGRTHHSMLRYPDLLERSFVCFSFGKLFHNTGWKVGYCIAPTALSAESRKIHQFNVFCVNHPVQLALADFLDDATSYRSLATEYARKRDLFAECLAPSRFRLLPCEGSYFQCADYSAISAEEDRTFVQRLAREYGVAAIPVSAFYHDGFQQTTLRFCFAKKDETLYRAAEKLVKV